MAYTIKDLRLEKGALVEASVCSLLWLFSTVNFSSITWSTISEITSKAWMLTELLVEFRQIFDMSKKSNSFYRFLLWIWRGVLRVWESWLLPQAEVKTDPMELRREVDETLLDGISSLMSPFFSGSSILLFFVHFVNSSKDMPIVGCFLHAKSTPLWFFCIDACSITPQSIEGFFFFAFLRFWR